MAVFERAEMPDLTDEDVRNAVLEERIAFHKEQLATECPGAEPESFSNLAALTAVFEIGFGIVRYDQTGEWYESRRD